MAENMVALVFTDLVNSTAIKNHLDGSSIREKNEAYRDTVLFPHIRHITEPLPEYGGEIRGEAGDGFFLVFPDAILAAQWAVLIQCSHLEEPISTPLGNLEVKIGMNIGAPLMEGDRIIGQEVDYAARVADLATGGQILLSENAAALVRSAQMKGIALHAHGERYLKGIGFTAVPIFELLYAGRSPRPLKGDVKRSELDSPINKKQEVRESLGLSEATGLANLPGYWSDDREVKISTLNKILELTSIKDLDDPQPSGEISLESPEGQVRIGSRFYIPSNYEERCYAEVKKLGSLIRIKSPHCMGKSSLAIRVLDCSKKLGYRTVNLNLEETNQEFFSSPDKFLQRFCTMVGRQLGVKVKTEDYWDDILGANDNTTEYFETYLLKSNQQPLVLAIDNFDRVFEYADIETDFCGMLRGWYGRSRNDALWGNLRIIIVHSQEPYLPKDINQSPFNVGLAIKLEEFTSSEVQVLIARHGLGWTEREVEQFTGLVGGHPYLVRSALYHLASGDLSLGEFLQTAPTEAGLYCNHLLGHFQVLEKYPRLGAAMKKVVTSPEPVQLPPQDAFKLDSRGLVVRNKNLVQPRCLLYRLYFCDRLGV